MKTEFYHLHEFIYDTLQPENLSTDNNAPDLFHSLPNISHKQRERLEWLVFDWLTDPMNKPAYPDMVHAMQTDLVSCANKIEQYLGVTNNNQMTSLYHAVLVDIEILLAHLEHRYPDYFDLNVKMPRHIQQREADLLVREWNLLISSKGKKKIDKKLLDVLQEYFYSFNKSDKDYTFQQVYYSKQLLSETSKAFEKKQPEKELLETLFFLRFNKRAFISYCASRIQNVLESNIPHKAKISKLAAAKHRIEPLDESSKWYYSMNRRTAKQTVIAILDIQLTQLEEQDKDPKDEPTGSKIPSFLDVILNITQIGLLARLLMLSKVTINQNYTQVVQVLCLFLRPNGADHSNPESARSNGPRADETTVRSLEDMLLRMIKALHELFPDYFNRS